VGDIQISGAAVTVLSAMFIALSSAVVYLFKSMQSAQDRRLKELRDDFQQTLKELRADFQERLDECRRENGRLTAYIDRQAGTVKESTELLKDISARIPTPGRS
jgi:ElaB/YqjD/DUF883 family membrane-anchored ribosome-binding protein